MSLELLLKHVPPGAVYRRVSLRDEENALGPWREAVGCLNHESNLGGVLAYGDEAGEDEALPAGLEPREVRELLSKNRRAFELLHEGLRRGRLQFPELLAVEQVPEDSEFACHLAELAQLPFILSRVLVAEGHLAAAAEELRRLLRMGQMISRGEGQVLHYLIGLWVRGAAHRGIQRLVADKDTPTEVLAAMLPDLDRCLAQPDGLGQSLLVDFCRLSLPQLDRMPDAGSLETLVDQFLALYYVHGPAAPDAAEEYPDVVPLDGWDIYRRRQILSVLEGHPRPFEKAATAQLMGRIVAEAVGNVEFPPEADLPDSARETGRNKCRRDLERQTKAWPAQLTPEFSCDPAGHGPMTSPVLDIPEAAMTGDSLTERQLPTEGELAAARGAIRRLDNPVGLVVAWHLLACDYSPFLFQHRAAMRDTRRMLGERLARP